MKTYHKKFLYLPKNNLRSNVNCKYKQLTMSKAPGTQLSICQGNRWQMTCPVRLQRRKEVLLALKMSTTWLSIYGSSDLELFSKSGDWKVRQRPGSTTNWA